MKNESSADKIRQRLSHPNHNSIEPSISGPLLHIPLPQNVWVVLQVEMRKVTQK